tara:strand:+ start:2299 stop:2436 length:138 start_codon:yes stop_codon:yes gene_type:complete
MSSGKEKDRNGLGKLIVWMFVSSLGAKVLESSFLAVLIDILGEDL